MHLLEKTHVVVNKYPAQTLRAALAITTALAIAYSYVFCRLCVYTNEARQWDVNWGGMWTNQKYINTMRNIGLPPDWHVPPRPTFWNVPFDMGNWVLFAAATSLVVILSVLGTVLIHRMINDNE